ncbi:leucine-rich repeat domain-containing protein [Treponema socranskii]|uniref:leucine-rich repeat domain-containing protein n=1 Tax=Treponema socranskii TaxID=53419 RepID=UPI003D947303
MKIHNSKTKAFAFSGAAFVLLITLLFTGCSNAASEEGTGGTPQAPLVEGGASLVFKAGTVTVSVITADGTAVTVEGGTVPSLASGSTTTLNASGTAVILKGNIRELYCRVYGNNDSTALNVQGLSALEILDCSNNQLSSLTVQGCIALESLNCNNNQLTSLTVQGCTALKWLQCLNNQLTSLTVQGCTALKWLQCLNNQLTSLTVQGCTALQGLECYNNQLTAQAFTQVLADLPTRLPSDYARCVLYTEILGEGNCTDFTAPSELAGAFNDAKNNKHWRLYKNNSRFDSSNSPL